MRLLCRECSALYDAPDNLFGDQPREVRCNRCGYQWTVVGAVKAVPSAPPPAMTSAGMPPDLIRDPPAPPRVAPAADSVPAPAAAALASPPLPAKTSPLADNLAGPLPSPSPPVMPASAAPIVAEPAPSTRSLLKRDEAAPDLDMGDPEERRLSHELSFGESERPAVAMRPSRSRWRGLWLVVMLIIVLAIAAILFEPQIVGAVPALGRVYAALGL